MCVPVSFDVSAFFEVAQDGVDASWGGCPEAFGAVFDFFHDFVAVAGFFVKEYDNAHAYVACLGYFDPVLCVFVLGFGFQLRFGLYSIGRQLLYFATIYCCR